MNLSYKKCKTRPGKCPDKQKQEEMITKIEKMEEDYAKGEAIMLFEDAVHQLHTTSLGYCIQRKGNEHTKVLESNTGRQRFTISGVINPHNGKFTSVQTKATCNIEFMKTLLDKIKEDYKEDIKLHKTIYIILDNARYQRAYEVQNYAKELGLTLIFLPPYCPHLNIIERLRRWMKKKLRNIYFPTFDGFCSHILDILSSIENSYDELRGFLSMKFSIM